MSDFVCNSIVSWRRMVKSINTIKHMLRAVDSYSRSFQTKTFYKQCLENYLDRLLRFRLKLFFFSKLGRYKV